MKNMLKKNFLRFIWILSIWYITIAAINYTSSIYLPPKLFLYDLFTGFRDNIPYLTDTLLPATFYILTLSVLFILLLEMNTVMYWDVRIRKLHFHVGDLSFLRRHKKLLMIMTIVSAFGLLAIPLFKQLYIENTSTWDGSLTIAHAGGIIDENDYTNSLEAILSNYGKGQRVFEIDFAVTSDNKLVCKHGWKAVLQEGGISGEAMDEQTFMSRPILGQYTPLSLETLCQLMMQYPDMWVVTDTKDVETELVQRDFEIMVNTVKACGMESVLDRIIVQIYNEEMYETINHIYPFQSWIYTLYKFWMGDTETFRECVRFCYEHDINGITTWNHYVTAELLQITAAYGIPWYAHTENDVENAKDMIQQGLSGIYTDTITPDLLLIGQGVSPQVDR